MADHVTIDRIPLKNPNIVMREEFDDWALLFDPDTGKVFGINPTGVMIWKQMDGTSSLKKIAECIAQIFKENHTEVITDVGDFVDQLVKINFISLKEG